VRPAQLAEYIKRLTARDLAELNRLLRDLPGWEGGAGVREPRRPRTPLDARGVELDSTEGKVDLR
jgi:hypothetical protein